MTDGFMLDPRLASDTLGVVELTLCEVRLMNDARYPWLVLVPRRSDMAEVSDLDDLEQAMLWREVASAASALRAAAPFEKLNIGALGNIVRQLHVHVLGRHAGDPAWPGPVWGHGKALPYDLAQVDSLIASLRKQVW